MRNDDGRGCLTKEKGFKRSISSGGGDGPSPLPSRKADNSSPAVATDEGNDQTMYAGSVALLNCAGSAGANADVPASGLGVKRKVDQFEAPNGHVPPGMPNGSRRNTQACNTESIPIQPLEHKAIDVWKFPAKRLLLQVDVPARFWDDHRGTRLYVDFRSQESKDTKRHRELGAIPDGEEGAMIKLDRDRAKSG